jgi:hypothetical protein
MSSKSPFLASARFSEEQWMKQVEFFKPFCIYFVAAVRALQES